MRSKFEKFVSDMNRVANMESLFKLRTNLAPIKELESFESWEEDKSKKLESLDIDSCPLCFNTDCLDTSDLITCKECGYVVARPFDNTAEYRYFSQEDRG